MPIPNGYNGIKMAVRNIKIEPKYVKENGLIVVDIDKLKIPFEIKERNLVYIPPKEKGGNHKHPRTEAFIGIGKGLKIIWEDGNGGKFEKYMDIDKKLFLFIVTANTPHAIINTSKTQFGMLIELADNIQYDVEKVNLL